MEIHIIPDVHVARLGFENLGTFHPFLAGFDRKTVSVFSEIQPQIIARRLMDLGGSFAFSHLGGGYVFSKSEAQAAYNHAFDTMMENRLVDHQNESLANFTGIATVLHGMNADPVPHPFWTERTYDEHESRILDESAKEASVRVLLEANKGPVIVLAGRGHWPSLARELISAGVTPHLHLDAEQFKKIDLSSMKRRFEEQERNWKSSCIVAESPKLEAAVRDFRRWDLDRATDPSTSEMRMLALELVEIRRCNMQSYARRQGYPAHLLGQAGR